jgi:hypothetical protein
MKMSPNVKRLLPVVLLSAVLWISGCATAPPVDWNSRVGHYTYAQAINELGPPNREARLSNGAKEVKWFVPAVGTIGTPNSMNNGLGVGPNTIGTSPASFSDRYLQLTFGGNGVLTDWSKNY